MTGRFTGKHMAAILLAFFAVVLAVNLLLARLAGATFGGVVVENSYVASQHFNRWLDAAASGKRLGWQAAAARQSDGRVVVRLTGVPGDAQVIATARHPLGQLPDVQLAFSLRADSTRVSDKVLPDGRWRLRLEIAASGQTWRSEEDVR